MTKIDPSLRFLMLEELEHALYKRTRVRHEEELKALIQENSQLCSNAQREVFFRGKLYFYGIKGRSESPVNCLKSPLRTRFKDYLDRVEMLEKEIALVKGFFQNIMQKTDRAEDYFALIPDCLHSAIRTTATYLSQEPGKFTDEEVTAFLEENQKYVDMITTRMTYNLLEVNHC